MRRWSFSRQCYINTETWFLVTTVRCHWLSQDTGYGGGSADPPGHWNVFPESSMSLMRVSIGVLPTSLTKKSCSITEADTVLREGSLSNSLPNLVGWLGYWVLQYSSSAHWDFSWSCSMVPDSVRPHASTMRGSQSSSQLRSQRIQCTKRAFCVVMLLLSEPCVPATNYCMEHILLMHILKSDPSAQIARITMRKTW